MGDVVSAGASGDGMALRADHERVSGLAEIVDRTTPDGRFSFAEAGATHGPTIVFLHGIGGAARAWRAQLAHFGRAARAVAWDMPGYGGSAPLAAGTIRGPARALGPLLRRVRAQPPGLVRPPLRGMI